MLGKKQKFIYYHYFSIVINVFGGLIHMWNAFYNPAEAIEDAKKLGSWGYTLGALVIAAVLFALAPVIWLKSAEWIVPVSVLVGAPVGVFIGALFLKIVLAVLGAKNPGYLECLTAIAYSLAPLSVAVLAAVVLSLIPYAGAILAALVAMIGGIASTAAYLRGIMELTETDLLTSIVSIWIVASIGTALSYITVMSTVMSTIAGMSVVNITG
jgi:hypothetical protein